jgi:hypothetical protein
MKCNTCNDETHNLCPPCAIQELQRGWAALSIVNDLAKRDDEGFSLRKCELSEVQLHAALDGLMAYDLGATDSGIHDEALKARVKAQLAAMPDNDRGALLKRFSNYYLTPEARLKGYGEEDVEEFFRWLRDERIY